MLSPEQQVLRLASSMQVSAVLHAITELGIPDLLKDGPLDVAVLAKETGSNEDALYRAMRMLASLELFDTPSPRTFALTPLSERLRRDVPGSVRAMVLWVGSPAAWRAWGLTAYSIRTGQPAFPHAMGAGVFDHLAKNPALAEVFDSAMASISARVAPAVAEAYDFSRFQKVMDVAGGTGVLLRAVLERHPSVRGVLFDLPEVIDRAEAVRAEAAIAERLEFASGSFFEPLPTGADAILLKNILHDWDDESCARLLKRCRDALPASGKVLAVEEVLADGPGASVTRLLDLQMLVMTQGGRQRTEAELSALFERAGLELERVVPTEAGPSVVEARVRHES